ncbi:MAG: metallophosphoesterase [Phycisphaerae bacterium]|nr:metallophosphoesterase [Phycisphaerae bacterium]
MRLLLVHLSDCHFRADRGVSSLLRRADALADAIAAKCMEVDTCLLALSGDQAYSGKPAEYTVVDEFVRAVKSRITACRSGLTLHAVAIPGNHDCDFSLNQQVRDVVLKSLDVDQLTDNSIVGACTSVQQGFFDWVKTLDPSDPHPFKDPLIHVRDIALGTESIRFVLVNSAWCSTLKEQQGSLKYPPNRLAQVRDLDGQPAVVVGLVHHPFNWLQADNARNVRESLESIADLILTGHEHVSDTYRRTGPRGEQNDYVEGGVLQDDQGEDSSLNLIVIDTAAQTQQAIQYRLIDGTYRQLSDQAVTRAFERNKRRLRGEFVLAESFERGVLDDVGVNFTHPRVETLRLRDVFVYPDARRLRRRPGEEPGQLVLSRDLLSFVMGNKRSLLLGEEQAGKTALARTLYRELRHNGVIPVLIGGAQLSKGS